MIMVRRERRPRWDLTGIRCGKWVVLKRSSTVRHRYRGIYWVCMCDCGNTGDVRGTRLRKRESLGCRRCTSSKKTWYPKTVSPEEGARRSLFSHYRANARWRNVSFDLPLEVFTELTTQKCRYCGIEPEQVKRNISRGYECVYSGLDRVDNSQGYTPTNSVPCCEKCNRAKRNMSIDDFHTWIKRLTENRPWEIAAHGT